MQVARRERRPQRIDARDSRPSWRCYTSVAPQVRDMERRVPRYRNDEVRATDEDPVPRNEVITRSINQAYVCKSGSEPGLEDRRTIRVESNVAVTELQDVGKRRGWLKRDQPNTVVGLEAAVNVPRPRPCACTAAIVHVEVPQPGCTGLIFLEIDPSE